MDLDEIYLKLRRHDLHELYPDARLDISRKTSQSAYLFSIKKDQHTYHTVLDTDQIKTDVEFAENFKLFLDNSFVYLKSKTTSQVDKMSLIEKGNKKLEIMMEKRQIEMRLNELGVK